MNKVWKAGVALAALVSAQVVLAEEPVGPAPEEAAGVVQVSPTGEQVVTVNTGNETVDAAANYAARCIEKAAAMQACGGGFKGIACKKTLEMTKYKGLDCPTQ